MTEEEILGKDLAKDLKDKKETAEKNKKGPEKKEKVKIDLKNVLGEDVNQADYFYSTDGKDTAPSYFNKVCGYAVTREDMLKVFNKIFSPESGVLFYKVEDKEVYIIIVPIKYSSIVGKDHESIDGDFQKHAISFITEGSVNLDTLRQKLLKVASTIKIVA